jgi:hypothetical protein
MSQMTVHSRRNINFALVLCQPPNDTTSHEFKHAKEWHCRTRVAYCPHELGTCVNLSWHAGFLAKYFAEHASHNIDGTLKMCVTHRSHDEPDDDPLEA